MIPKERLLAGLNEVIYVEEGMITTLANFSKALLGHSEGVPAEVIEKMTKMLTRLYNDSSRHKETVESLMNASGQAILKVDDRYENTSVHIEEVPITGEVIYESDNELMKKKSPLFLIALIILVTLALIKLRS